MPTLIRTDPCPVCGGLWFTFEPSTGCAGCSRPVPGRPRMATPPLSERGRRYRLEVTGEVTAERIRQVTEAQGGECVICEQTAILDLDADPVTLKVLAGICRGCHLIVSRCKRSSAVVLDQYRVLKSKGLHDRADRHLAIYRYLRAAEKLREGAAAATSTPEPPEEEAAGSTEGEDPAASLTER